MPTENKKTESLKLRLMPDEKMAFQNAADISGLPLSAWVRERLRKAATRDLETSGQEIPFLRHLYEDEDK
jgi:uncharacterized protein (DUF1778 family)